MYIVNQVHPKRRKSKDQKNEIKEITKEHVSVDVCLLFAWLVDDICKEPSHRFQVFRKSEKTFKFITKINKKVS